MALLDFLNIIESNGLKYDSIRKETLFTSLAIYFNNDVVTRQWRRASKTGGPMWTKTGGLHGTVGCHYLQKYSDAVMETQVK